MWEEVKLRGGVSLKGVVGFQPLLYLMCFLAIVRQAVDTTMGWFPQHCENDRTLTNTQCLVNYSSVVGTMLSDLHKVYYIFSMLP